MRKGKESAIVEAVGERATIKNGADGLVVDLVIRSEGKRAAQQLDRCCGDCVTLTGHGSGTNAPATSVGTLRKIQISKSAKNDKPVQIRATISGGRELEQCVSQSLLLERTQRELLPEEDHATA